MNLGDWYWCWRQIFGNSYRYRKIAKYGTAGTGTDAFQGANQLPTHEIWSYDFFYLAGKEKPSLRPMLEQLFVWMVDADW